VRRSRRRIAVVQLVSIDQRPSAQSFDDPAFPQRVGFAIEGRPFHDSATSRKQRGVISRPAEAPRLGANPWMGKHIESGGHDPIQEPARRVGNSVRVQGTCVKPGGKSNRYRCSPSGSRRKANGKSVVGEAGPFHDGQASIARLHVRFRIFRPRGGQACICKRRPSKLIHTQRPPIFWSMCD